MFVAKIEESDKAGGHQELNPGHLAWATSALPLSYDNWTTTPHNVQHRDKSWQPARCPGFNFQWLLAFAVSSIFASKHLNFTLFQHEARVLNIHINNIATFIIEVHARNLYLRFWRICALSSCLCTYVSYSHFHTWVNVLYIRIVHLPTVHPTLI